MYTDSTLNSKTNAIATRFALHACIRIAHDIRTDTVLAPHSTDMATYSSMATKDAAHVFDEAFQ